MTAIETGQDARRAALRFRALVLTMSLAIAPAIAVPAAEMPERAALEQALGQPPQVVKVFEPHLSTPAGETTVPYLGWPAEPVLDHLLGPAWREAGAEVEFRALDGYVSRVPVERFAEFRAFLVVARTDQPDFTVDNLAQHETGVPLGPYYLVWDNIGQPELLADGATYWPYQVAEILVSRSRTEALLPGGMAADYAEVAALAQKHCLSCHQVNGYGGDKWPIDLAERVGAMTEAEFRRWVLTPATVKPGTAMPPLAARRSEPEREALAEQLYAYLTALSVQGQ